jgi:flagellar basal body-associated protein FliL
VGGEKLSAATSDWEANHVNILWIILIVILVLALLGFFSRGRW